MWCFRVIQCTRFSNCLWGTWWGQIQIKTTTGFSWTTARCMQCRARWRVRTVWRYCNSRSFTIRSTWREQLIFLLFGLVPFSLFFLFFVVLVSQTWSQSLKFWSGTASSTLFSLKDILLLRLFVSSLDLHRSSPKTLTELWAFRCSSADIFILVSAIF